MAGRRIEIGMVMASPNVIDDRVPGQPEEPAPERDAPRLVARQSLQGLDEDELRQVFRIRRAVDTAGDIAVDREVEVVEQATEGPGVPVPSFPHQPLDRGIVEDHNESGGAALGHRRSAARRPRIPTPSMSAHGATFVPIRRGPKRPIARGGWCLTATGPDPPP